jgi:hypothetical protein
MQVLQMEEGPSLQMAPETFNLRLEELAVIDMAFLAASSSSGTGGAGSSAAAAAAGAAHPVLALLYEDNKHARHVKTYTLNLKTRVGGNEIWKPFATRCAWSDVTCCSSLQSDMSCRIFSLSSYGRRTYGSSTCTWGKGSIHTVSSQRTCSVRALVNRIYTYVDRTLTMCRLLAGA